MRLFGEARAARGGGAAWMDARDSLRPIHNRRERITRHENQFNATLCRAAIRLWINESILP